jgi:hypothetical protein
VRFIMIGVVTIILGGCASMSDVINSKKDGTQHDYPVTCDQAFDIARSVFRKEGADAIEEHRSEGYMLTSSSSNLVTKGSVMGAWVDPAQPGHCLVTVVTKRKIATNLATTLTETTFHNRFAEIVASMPSSGRGGSQAPASTERGGCTKDTDCKGNRICVKGACTDPGK